jgi:hypothetical protein
MGTRDPNSPGSNSSQDAGKTADSQRFGNQTAPVNRDWTKGERRHPDNARIRRWMDLGDKALQNTGEEEDPIADSVNPKEST